LANQTTWGTKAYMDIIKIDIGEENAKILTGLN
jgi:hypothetical protein